MVGSQLMNGEPQLKLGKDVPVTWWSSNETLTMTPEPPTVLILLIGLFLFGLGDAVIISAKWGVAPWTVLADGIAQRLDLTIGVATFLVSIAVLFLWIPLRERPGIGTLLNIIIIAGTIDLALPYLGESQNPSNSIFRVLFGTALIGIGSALYLTCNLGPGPRDGWMTGIHRATGYPIGIVRGTIEASVLLAGWLLGGDLWYGTLIFAVFIGPAVAVFLRITSKIASDQGPEMNTG
ncbi:MAG: hypothetical protein VXY31_05685 [Candidatus Thermoplasmatota archaeon]|nr:hypothetical protein [Candidatus Thermoplasmatota archaeon]